MNQCEFNKAWIGQCTNARVIGTVYCEEHLGKVCSSCGTQATHECAETGQFVCGAFLCDDCEHFIYESGTNGGIGFNAEAPPEGFKSHCKKSEQVNKPWYEKEKEQVANKSGILNLFLELYKVYPASDKRHCLVYDTKTDKLLLGVVIDNEFETFSITEDELLDVNKLIAEIQSLYAEWIAIEKSGETDEND